MKQLRKRYTGWKYQDFHQTEERLDLIKSIYASSGDTLLVSSFQPVHPFHEEEFAIASLKNCEYL